MKFILKSTLLIFVFLFSIIVFLPKEGIYNFLEQKLSEKNILISNEVREENLVSLDLTNMILFYDEINSAIIQSTKIKIFLFLNEIKLKNIRVSSTFKKFVPEKIDNIILKYSILDIKSININAEGDFGLFHGKYNLFENRLEGELKPSSMMKTKYRNILNNFKFNEGKYTYELAL
jgi:hypothetical protein